MPDLQFAFGLYTVSGPYGWVFAACAGNLPTAGRDDPGAPKSASRAGSFLFPLYKKVLRD